jgi:DNA-binding winged helix-turn-helix (wHTH) protein/tetratricopeptide (TPR) repeat protein
LKQTFFGLPAECEGIKTPACTGVGTGVARELMDNEVFVFGQCEVRVATREVLLAGAQQAMEPRPFELLVYLIRHRGRIVSKDELLDKLWSFDFVTASVIARAVMKIRKVIGDDGETGELIKTVHRTGYRFMGQVREKVAPPMVPAERPAMPSPAQPDPLPSSGSALAPVAAATVTAPVSLALLPFENLTGSGDLDWLELGLLSLVVRDLGAHPRMQVSSIPSLLNALQAVPKESGFADRADDLARLLAVRHVARVEVHGGPLRFELRCTLVGEGRTDSTMLAATGLPNLGRSLVRWLEARFFPGEAAAELHPDAGDSVLGRALQAIAEQKWTLALELLDQVLRLEPAHLGAQVERLRALVAMDDSAAFELGDLLLARLREEPNQAAEAAVHFELAQAHVRRRVNDKAKHHLEEALHSAPGKAARESVVATTLLRAGIAINEFDFTVASALVDRAEMLCNGSGSVFDQLRILALRMVIEGETGSMVQAWNHARRSASLYRDHGVLVGQARAECNVANSSASLGHFRMAEEHGEAGLAISRSLQVPTDSAVSAMLLCGVYRQLRKPTSLARVLSILESVDTGDGPRNEGFRLIGRAHYSLAIGQVGEAAWRLSQAADEAAAKGQEMQLHFVLPLLAGALIHDGQLDAADEACGRIASLTKLARDRNLQGALWHSQAQLALARGDRDRAIALLRKGRDVTPLGWWNAHSRLDGAWLCIEEGRSGEAVELLRGLETWLDEHPAGLAVSARLLHAQGRSGEARATHARLAAGIDGALPAWLLELGGCYEGQRAVEVPRAPCVVTWL